MPDSALSAIAITPGEPAGIGPDIVIQLAQQASNAQRVVIGSGELLHSRAALLKLPLKLTPFDVTAPRQPSAASELSIIDLPLKQAVAPGTSEAANADYVLQTLDTASQLCMNGKLDALVTGPINKHLINLGASTIELPFSGHTEYLARISNSPRVVMLLAAEQSPTLKQPLRVALATTHLPLKDVAASITDTLLSEVIRVLHHDLIKHFGIAKPRIAVCGLNPHAGEDGDLGNEEINIIEPCLNRMRASGIQLSVPLPADTLFTDKHLENTDAVLAMYHDQGLPVLKSHSFGCATNITLGLPYIRCSVDHGTAFDLAGTGTADTGSLSVAFNTAVKLGLAKRGFAP
jgi:4-hydroxythreonine-4-phosphate dehydrogenase